MKRALSAVAVGGVLVLMGPAVAFADAAPVPGYQVTDHPGDQGSPEPDGAEQRDGATAPEGTGQPEQAPPGHPYGDREQHDDEEGTILF